MGILTNILVVIVVIIIVYIVLRFIYPNSLQLKNVKSGTVVTSINASSLPNGESSNYAYSIWFYVKNWEHRLADSKVILDRSNGPKISFTPYSNNIEVDIALNAASAAAASASAASASASASASAIASATASVSTTDEKPTCNIVNVPLQKWTNIILSLNGRTTDVYLDGKLVRTCLLPTVPSNPSGNVSITPGGGFSGWTSNFQYWPNPLNPNEAYDVYKNGPGSVKGLGKILNNHKVKFSYLVNEEEKGSIEF
jgi:hypothetical protein